MLVCPGLANDSESLYICTCVHYAQSHGFRVAVLNHLGVPKDVPLTTDRVFNYGKFPKVWFKQAQFSKLILFCIYLRHYTALSKKKTFETCVQMIRLHGMELDRYNFVIHTRAVYYVKMTGERDLVLNSSKF